MDIATASFGFDTDLTLDQAWAVVQGGLRVVPSADAWARCDIGHARLRLCIEEARHVYGLTTGFGPLANRLIDPDDGVELQQNLINHLATGLGAPLGWAQARATCLARLCSIMRGVSGASRDGIDCLITLLNSDLAPLIPERGTVGASGDLTPLAHVVLAFQGRGAFLAPDGTAYPGPRGLEKLGLAPLDLRHRDGLALVNGTSAMTGIALCNALQVRRLINFAISTSAVLLEVCGGRAEAWAQGLANLRPHPGQVLATRRLNACLRGSTRIEAVPLSDRRLGADSFRPEEVIGQDAYSLRCVPQIIGAVLDAAAWHDQVLEIELNAVSDNPVFPGDGPTALHGGNFMGQHIALVSDSLATALVVLAGLLERQVARLTDERLNGGLPAFLHSGRAGLNSGFMGAQVTASATLAEMRSIGRSSIHSISTNGANQDVVSMGTIAARNASRQVVHLSEILAIQTLCLVQAMDLTDPGDGAGYSPAALNLRKAIRSGSATLAQDRPLSADIARLALHLRKADHKGDLASA